MYWVDSRLEYAGIYMANWKSENKTNVLKRSTKIEAFTLNPEEGYGLCLTMIKSF